MGKQIDLAGFAGYLTRVRARSVRTAEAYRRDVEAYARFCRDGGLGWPAGLTRTQVGLYLVQRTAGTGRPAGGQQQLGQRSAARVVSALSAYCQYLVAEGRFKSNPLKGFRPPKYSRKLPAYYSVKEVEALLKAFNDDSTPLGRRNQALLLFLYSTGIRVGECESLDLGSVNLEAQLAVVQGKGGKQRAVPFGGAATRCLAEYVELARPALASRTSGEAVFLSKSGRRLSARAIQQVLDRAAVRAGLAKALSPHKLRHAYATHMLEGGADVRLLQELLGHESLGTTQQYTKVTRTKLRDIYLKSHPRATRD